MFTVARSAKMDLPGKPASCDNGSWRFRRHDPPINRQSRLSRTAGCLASPQTMSKRFVYVLRNHVEPATVLRRRHLRGGATPRGAQRWQLYPYCQVPSVVSWCCDWIRRRATRRCVRALFEIRIRCFVR